MAGVLETTRRASRMVFSSSYLDETLAFIVPDYRRADFSSADWIRGTPGLRVAELYPISTNHVTFMEFIHGEKITNAFPGQPKERAIMARRLIDVMTFDVIFAPKEVAIFHGDPHAGNVYHVANDPSEPYRIAMLDWGLYGRFPREERLALMQLILGVKLGDAKRLRKYSGVLLEHGLPDSPEKLRRIDVIIVELINSKGQRSSFEVLEELLFALNKEGYQTKFSLNLFIKSQMTIAGIIVELDPTLDQDEYLEKHISGLVKKELPKRFLYTIWFPAWNSRSYRSLLSNGDVMSSAFKKPKKKSLPAQSKKLSSASRSSQNLEFCPN
ncbi:MAG: AarF/UbiB family protein [Acidobacteria bacterium]|nr:AarF/UbiB family protein [Acidobacteriota bacterium]